MSFIGAAIGGAVALYGANQQAGAAKDAGNQQFEASSAATGLQRQIMLNNNKNNAPYLAGGEGAMSLLGKYLGTSSTSNPEGLTLPNGQTVKDAALAAWNADMPRLSAAGNADPATYAATDPSGYQSIIQRYEQNIMQQNPDLVKQNQSDPNFGSLLHNFDANDLKTNLSPNYDFMLSQGQGAANNLANLSGGAISGNALKGINDYTQNYASNAYQQAYNNYTNNQNNIYARLTGVATLGQNSANNVGSQNVASGQGMANSTMSGGQAQASGIVGSANAMAGGLNNAASYYNLGSIMNGSSGGGYASNYGGAGMSPYATGMSDIYSQLNNGG